MRRTKYTVRYYEKCPFDPRSCGCSPSWGILVNGGVLDTWKRKRDAIAFAVKYAKEEQPSQVVIKGKDGRIQSERTYPDVTPRRKG